MKLYKIDQVKQVLDNGKLLKVIMNNRVARIYISKKDEKYVWDDGEEFNFEHFKFSDFVEYKPKYKLEFSELLKDQLVIKYSKLV